MPRNATDETNVVPTVNPAPSFWQTEPGRQYSSARQLNADEKRVLADERTPFEITDIREVASREYGPCWMVNAYIVGRGNNVAIAFGMNEQRDAQFNAMIAYLDSSNPRPVIPARLGYYENQYGPVWLIQEPDALPMTVNIVQDDYYEEVPF